ncbi:Bacterial transcription activator, effector binding domain protein [Verrucomicrobiia bacterium DG1235]|nr:Bacterial transcription activator, effector binding domain protein [Verrucomicrobiae bacterium DG1235]
MPKFDLERAITIEASAVAVFSYVKNFRDWRQWSPWILAEPNCKLEYAEDGSSYSWAGDIIGAGEMELLEAEEGKALHYRLTFLKPWKSTSSVSFYFEECREGTNTRWTMEGSLPFFLFWMKRMLIAGVGMDYDRGLLMLKDQIELGAVPSVLEFAGNELVPGCEYVGITSDCSMSEIGERMAEDLEKLSSAMEENAIATTGRTFALYHKFNMSQATTRYTIAKPVGPATTCPSELVSGLRPELHAYTIRHRGAYRHLGNAWAAGMMHGRAKLFAQHKKRPPFEVYGNDPNQVEESNLLTTIYFPIK